MTLSPADQSFAAEMCYEAVAIMRRQAAFCRYAMTDQDIAMLRRDVHRMVSGLAHQLGHRVMPLPEQDPVPEPDTGQVWLLNPLDGRRAFTCRLPGATFSLTLLRNGIPVAAYVHDVATEHLTVCQGQSVLTRRRGAGDTRVERRRVTGTRTLTGSHLVLPGSAAHHVDTALLHTTAVDAGANIISTGAPVADGMLVALGFADAAVYPHLSPADVAAPAAATAAAGGHVTDLHGNVQRYDSPVRGAVLSNGVLHRRVLDLVASCPGGTR